MVKEECQTFLALSGNTESTENIENLLTNRRCELTLKPSVPLTWPLMTLQLWPESKRRSIFFLIKLLTSNTWVAEWRQELAPEHRSEDMAHLEIRSSLGKLGSHPTFDTLSRQNHLDSVQSPNFHTHPELTIWYIGKILWLKGNNVSSTHLLNNYYVQATILGIFHLLTQLLLTMTKVIIWKAERPLSTNYVLSLHSISHALHTWHCLIFNQISCKQQMLTLTQQERLLATSLDIPQRQWKGWRTRLKIELPRTIPTPHKMIWWEKPLLLPSKTLVHYC